MEANSNLLPRKPSLRQISSYICKRTFVSYLLIVQQCTGGSLIIEVNRESN